MWSRHYYGRAGDKMNNLSKNQILFGVFYIIFVTGVLVTLAHFGIIEQFRIILGIIGAMIVLWLLLYVRNRK